MTIMFGNKQVDVFHISKPNNKYGAKVDNFLGDVDETGLLKPPSGDVLNLSFNGVKFIEGDHVLAYKFTNAQNIGKVDFPNLTAVYMRYSLFNTFFKSSVKEVNFPELTEISEQSCSNICARCYYLTSVNFPKLKTLRSKALEGAFSYAGYFDADGFTTISFPSLTSVATDAFGIDNNTYAFLGCIKLTEIHFRADRQATIEAMTGYADKWGATNATIYFDL